MSKHVQFTEKSSIQRNDLLKYVSKARMACKKVKNKDFALGMDNALFLLQRKFNLFEFDKP